MTFEQIKNSKALAWTVAVHALLLLLFITFRYTLPAQPQEPEEMLMEVNLGTGDEGFGNDQPEIPEDPAPPEAAVAVSSTQTTQEENNKEVLTTDKAEAPAIINKPKVNNKPSKPDTKPTEKNIPNKVATNNTTSNANKTQVQKPKYTFPNSNGSGGNSAANNRPGGNEGIGSGNGDMGRPGGVPGGKTYVGFSARLGDRKLVGRPDPKADFNVYGKVKVAITVNRQGKIVNYRITSGDAALRRLVEQKIQAVRFNALPNAPVEQFGELTFDFKKSVK